MSIIDLTDNAEFNEFINKSNKPIVVDFFTPTCGPCKSLAMFIDKLSNEYADKLEFCKVDVSKRDDLQEQLNVQTVPCVVCFNNGFEIARIVGNNQAKVKEIVEFLAR